MSNSFDDFMDAAFKAHAEAETIITKLVYEEDFMDAGVRIQVWMNNKKPRWVTDETGEKALFPSREHAYAAAHSAFDQWEKSS